MIKPGTITVFCGCMFASKTEHLISKLKRSKYEKKRVRAFKPVIENRYSAEDIVSHGGISFNCVPVETAIDIIARVSDADVVGIDEIQFFDDTIVDVCLSLAAAGKSVIASGLDLDYKGLPFGPMPHLLSIADVVKKQNAACTICGNVATRSQRIVDSSEQVVVGGAKSYEARCLVHWSPEPVFTQQTRVGEALDD